MIEKLIEQLRKGADEKGINIKQEFLFFIDEVFELVKKDELPNQITRTYLTLAAQYPFEDILNKVCVEIGLLEHERGQFMTPLDTGYTLNEMQQMKEPEMLDFTCGTGVMGLIKLKQLYCDLVDNGKVNISDIGFDAEIHLNDLSLYLTKIATIQIYTNWVVHCQMLFELDLLVTQNNVITDWIEPLKVIYQSSGSDQNYSSLSVAKKKNLMLNPPFGLKDYGIDYALANSDQSRFSYGVPKKGDCEYAFILSAIDLLTEYGKAFLILPNGVCYKNSTKKFRKAIREAGLLEGVIGLPPKLFDETSIPTTVFMLNKQNPNPDKVFIMNVPSEAA